jgi:hypothetical protein
MSRLLLAALITAFSAHAKAPVITIQTTTFGRVLAAPNHLALYYWTPETRDHRIHCPAPAPRRGLRSTRNP